MIRVTFSWPAQSRCHLLLCRCLLPKLVLTPPPPSLSLTCLAEQRRVSSVGGSAVFSLGLPVSPTTFQFSLSAPVSTCMHLRLSGPSKLTARPFLETTSAMEEQTHVETSDYCFELSGICLSTNWQSWLSSAHICSLDHLREMSLNPDPPWVVCCLICKAFPCILLTFCSSSYLCETFETNSDFPDPSHSDSKNSSVLLPTFRKLWFYWGQISACTGDEVSKLTVLALTAHSCCVWCRSLPVFMPIVFHVPLVWSVAFTFLPSLVTYICPTVSMYYLIEVRVLLVLSTSVSPAKSTISGLKHTYSQYLIEKR